MEEQYQKYFDKIMEVLQKIGTGFINEKIEFCLIGGVAVFLYHQKRISKDMDFLVKKEDINKAIKVLYKLFPETPLSNFHERREGDIWHIDLLYRPDDVARIDLIVPENEREEGCLADSTEVKESDSGSVLFRIAKPEWLIKLKEKAGRDRDLMDIDALKEYLNKKKI